MKISVIIPAFDNLPAVLTCLNSLRALAADPANIEWLVQDDASPNVLLPALIPPEVASVERNESNLGFAPNCNRAAKRATGDVLFFVNQDVYGVPQVSRGWDAALRAAFEGDPQIGVVGARLLFPNGTVQSAGGGIDGACQPYHPCLGWGDVNHPQVATSRECQWVTGAAIAVRRETWQAVVGFDPAYERGYFEDVDLCFKAREKGWAVVYEPAVTLIHSVGSTGGNPLFMRNATLWKQRWADTRKAKAEVPTIMVRFWA